MRKTTLITHPYFVHFLVLPRHHTFDNEIAPRFCFTTCVQRGVASHRALRTDRSSGAQLPRTCLETEVRCRQRADRTYICGVTRKNGIKSGVRECNDLHGASAFCEVNHRVAYNFILETDTACTLNTAFLIKDDQFAERHALFQPKLFIIDKATLAGPMCHGEILQWALAAFIADGAIQWMRSEQELNCSPLPILRLGRLSLREHHHALFHFICASCLKLGHELDLWYTIFDHELTRGAVAHRAPDLHQAHAAHAHRFKFWMVTKDGDVNFRHLGSIHHANPFRDCDLSSVNCECYLF